MFNKILPNKTPPDKPKKKRVQLRAKSYDLVTPARSELLYETDYYKWCKNQVEFLKQKEFSKLDLENLIEEVESLASMESRVLEDHLVSLLLHFLKWEYQPASNRSWWQRSINKSRYYINDVLKDNPSLHAELSSILEECYDIARYKAIHVTGLDSKKLPEKCPWTFEECMSEEFPKPQALVSTLQALS